ncbi:MAG: TraB/GumN family protein [Crocinitomicaceae bacterium]|nr:TraB/GumN family protein [Crocinitomicaceae bacterium]
MIKSILIPFLFFTGFLFGQQEDIRSVGDTSFNSARTILWSVKDSVSNRTSYLLGTYHQIGNSFVDSLTKIQDALFSTDLAIFESIDNGENVRAYLNSRDESQEYLTALKKSDIEFLQSFAADWGVPVSKLKPLELLTKLQQVYFETQCGSVKATDTWDHFDNYLIHLAQSNNIAIMGLESDSVQTANISNVGPDASWKIVKKSIHTWIEYIKHSKRTDLYCHHLRTYMSMAFDYQFDLQCNENPMIKPRNQEWMELIPDLIEENSCFIAVGLLHLYGDCGLIMQLRELGYTVAPVEL